MIIQRASTLIVVFVLLLGCDETDSQEGQFTHLKDPATVLSSQFSPSSLGFDYSVFTEIPPTVWGEIIANEDPIKVYSHYSNIALIFEESETSKDGIYIHVGFSSYIPQDTDSMKYSEIERDIYSVTIKSN